MKKIYLFTIALLFALFLGINNIYAISNLYVDGEPLNGENPKNTANTAFYDVDANTLTLKNYDGSPIQYSGEEDLTVILEGNNIITDGSYEEIGFYSTDAGVTFDGTGSLLINNSLIGIVLENGALKINNPNITIQNMVLNGIYVSGGKLIINGKLYIDISEEERIHSRGIIGIQARDVEINGDLIITNIDNGLSVYGDFIVNSGNSSIQSIGTVIHCINKVQMLGGSLDLEMTNTDISYNSYTLDALSIKISGGNLHVLAPTGKAAIMLSSPFGQEPSFEMDDTMEILPSGYHVQDIEEYTAKTIVSPNGDIANEVTIKEKVKYTYKYTKGNNLKFIQNKINNYELVIDGDYNLFDKLTIESLDLIKNTDYIVKEGSTIITFTESGLNKLNKLKPGTYKVSAKYTNSNVVDTELIIEDQNPNTVDNIILYTIMSIISLLGLCTVYYKKIRS